MKHSQYVQKALLVLRARLDADHVGFEFGRDSDHLLTALRPYLESQVLPLIDIIERGTPNVRERELVDHMAARIEQQKQISERARVAVTEPEKPLRTFKPREVTRADAGGQLYAPVDQHGMESGDTPSYDYHRIGRRCTQLNLLVKGRAIP